MDGPELIPVPLRPHPALYVLPVLFGVLGGVAAWLLLRGSGDYTISAMGRNCLLVGAISSLVSLVAYMALGVGVVEELRQGAVERLGLAAALRATRAHRRPPVRI